MRKAIYNGLTARIEAAGIGIRHISLWNWNIGQLPKQAAFHMPAVFVEFEPIEWSQLAGGARSAEVRVRLHVLTATLATPEKGSKYRDKALEHFDLLGRLCAAVQGFSGEGFNRFMLVESVTDNNHGEVRHDEERFVTRVTYTPVPGPGTTTTGVTLKNPRQP